MWSKSDATFVNNATSQDVSLDDMLRAVRELQESVDEPFGVIRIRGGREAIAALIDSLPPLESSATEFARSFYGIPIVKDAPSPVLYLEHRDGGVTTLYFNRANGQWYRMNFLQAARPTARKAVNDAE